MLRVRQGVRVVGAEHPQPVGQQLLERGGGARRVPRLPPPGGEVVPGEQGVRVVGAEHPQLVGQQLLERGGGARRVPRLPPAVGEVGPGAQGVRVVGAAGGKLLAKEDLILGEGLMVVVAVGQELGVLVSGDDDPLPVNGHCFHTGIQQLLVQGRERSGTGVLIPAGRG